MALKSKSRGKFEYKPRTVDQVKKYATRNTRKFDSVFKQGFNSFWPKKGDNLIRYLPATWDGFDHYGYTVYEHRYIGSDNSSYLCPKKMLNKPCPVCEAAKEADDAGEEEEAKALAPKQRVIAWVIDRDAEDPEKPLLYDNSYTQDQDVSVLCYDERTGEALLIDHPDQGYDISFKKTGQGKMGTKYIGHKVARRDSPINDNEKVQDGILDYIRENPVPDCLNYYEYDYLKGVLSGTVAEKDTDLDKDIDDEEEARPAKYKAKAKNDMDDDLPFDEPVARQGPRRDGEEIDEETGEVIERHKPAQSRTEPDPEDEEVDEEAEEFVEEVVRPRQTASRTSPGARQRVIEEWNRDDEPAPARPVRRSQGRRG